MSSYDEIFADLHPQIAEIIGIAVLQLLVEKREISKSGIIEVVQALWQEERRDFVVELALDALMLPS